MGETYDVIVAQSASRDIRRLAPALQRTVLAALTALGTESRFGKPLAGTLRGIWSLRRGDYRVLYRIDDPARRVEVARVWHRRDAYRRSSAEPHSA